MTGQLVAPSTKSVEPANSYAYDSYQPWTQYLNPDYSYSSPSVYNKQVIDAATAHYAPIYPDSVSSVWPSAPAIMEYKVIPTVFENAYEPRPIRPVYEPTQIVRTVVREVEKPVERVVEVEKPVERVVERIIEKPNDDNKEFIKKLDKLEDKIKDIYKKKEEPKEVDIPEPEIVEVPVASTCNCPCVNCGCECP